LKPILHTWVNWIFQVNAQHICGVVELPSLSARGAERCDQRVLPLCNLYSTLHFVYKSFIASSECKLLKSQASAAAAAHFWGLGVQLKAAVAAASTRADKSFNLSQSVGGCGGILKTEPPVVEMTNELSSAPGEADAQPTFGRAAAKICRFVVVRNETHCFYKYCPIPPASR
jgi:hypothetical protein